MYNQSNSRLGAEATAASDWLTQAGNIIKSGFGLYQTYESYEARRAERRRIESIARAEAAARIEAARTVQAAEIARRRAAEGPAAPPPGRYPGRPMLTGGMDMTTIALIGGAAVLGLALVGRGMRKSPVKPK